MKTHRNLILAALMWALVAPLAVAQTGHELFQQALRKERTEGDCAQAIPMYEKVAREAKQDRSLAAKALVRAGECHEKLGQDAARKAYQRVVSEFSDQNEQASIARTRLAALAPGVRREGGAVARLVWSGPGVDMMGSPSADGRHLSFVDWSTGDLAIRDLSSGQNRRLTNKGTWQQSDEYAEFSLLSPDAKQIAYGWFSGKFFYELRVSNVENPAPRVLYSNEETFYVQPRAWTPDGKSVVTVLSHFDHTNQLAVISVQGGAVRVLKSLDWRYPGMVSLSPDGRYLAYDFPPTEEETERDIYVLAMDGSRETQVVQHPAHDQLLGWSPDGGRLVFLSDRTGSEDAWIIKLADGKPSAPPEMVKRGLGAVVRIGMTPKGEFYYGLGGNRRDVMMDEFKPDAIDVARGASNVSARNIGTNYGPDWSPDGMRLAYLTRRGIGPFSRLLVVYDTASKTERTLQTRLRLPGAAFAAPRWSPDGRSLVIAAADAKGRRGVFQVDATTGETKALFLNPAMKDARRPVEWLSENEILFEQSDHAEGLSRIIARRLDTQDERVLHTGYHLHHWSLSYDKQRLAIATTGYGADANPRTSDRAAWVSNRLVIVPTAGGAEKEIARLQSQGEFQAVAWLPDNQHLVLTSVASDVPSAQDRQVARISVATGRMENIPLTFRERELQTLRFHPDGKRVAYSAERPDDSDVWVLENFLPPVQTASSR